MFSIEIMPAGPLAIVCLQGDIDGEELVEAAFAMREQMGEHQEMPQMWDGRAVGAVDVQPAFLEVVRSVAASRREHGLPVSGKRAVVTTNEALIAVGEVLADVLDGFGVEIRDFAEIEDALAWLREG